MANTVSNDICRRDNVNGASNASFVGVGASNIVVTCSGGDISASVAFGVEELLLFYPGSACVGTIAAYGRRGILSIVCEAAWSMC